MVGGLLRFVAIESHILQQDINIDSFNAFVQSLQEADGWQSTDLEFEFLDNCMQRIVKRPLKYTGDLRWLLQDSGLDSTCAKVSLLLVAALEQWPYLVDRRSSQEVKHAAQWLRRLLKNLADVGEDLSALRRIKTALSKGTSDSHTEEALRSMTMIFDVEPLERVQSTETELRHLFTDATPADAKGV